MGMDTKTFYAVVSAIAQFIEQTDERRGVDIARAERRKPDKLPVAAELQTSDGLPINGKDEVSHDCQS